MNSLQRTWKTIVGLELHVQLKGNHKLLSFTAQQTHSEAIPNEQVHPYDAALPGSLPRLASEPVRLALLASLALKSKIAPSSSFDRKHYFYHDLPAGFQVTQKYSPLATGGIVALEKCATTVRIEQIQLEQDTAKSSHDPLTGMTLVDLNRAGTALIEIVTLPDMRSSAEAAEFVKKLQSILRHVGASDANMDKGELRIDVNVSVQDSEATEFGTRCEVKNLNGIKFLVGAIEAERKRQIALLLDSKTVIQATLGYDPIKSETFFLRSKADAPDYRYMPDPELGKIVVTDSFIEELRVGMGELPDVARARIEAAGVSQRDADILVKMGEIDEDSSNVGIGIRYFDAVCAISTKEELSGKLIANWIINTLLAALAAQSPPLRLSESSFAPQSLVTLLEAVVTKRIKNGVAKLLLARSITENIPMTELLHLADPTWGRVAPTEIDLTSIITQILLDHPIEVEKYKMGQTKVLMRLLGAVMKVTEGKIDAALIKSELEKSLE